MHGGKAVCHDLSDGSLQQPLIWDMHGPRHHDQRPADHALEIEDTSSAQPRALRGLFSLLSDTAWLAESGQKEDSKKKCMREGQPALA